MIINVLEKTKNFNCIENVTQEQLIAYLNNRAFSHPLSAYSGKKYDSSLLNFIAHSSVQDWNERVGEVFKRRKNEPEFKGLIFFTGEKEVKQGFAKFKKLIDWGYNTRVLLEDTPYNQKFAFFGPEANVFHINRDSHAVKYLIENNLTSGIEDTTTIYPFLREYFLKNVVNEITTLDELKKLYRSVTKGELQVIDGFKLYSIIEGYTAFSLNSSIIKQLNTRFEQSSISYKPYETAQILKERKKELVLKEKETAQAVVERESAVLAQLKALNHKKQKVKVKRLMKEAVETDNAIVMLNLNQFDLKAVGDQNVLSLSIKNNNLKWVEHITSMSLLQKEDAEDCLLLAYRYKRPKVFTYLYEKGWHGGLELTIGDINRAIEYCNGSEENILKLVCPSIVYFLAKKGYPFKNEVIIEKIIRAEKKNLQKQLNIIEVPITTKKSFKI